MFPDVDETNTKQRSIIFREIASLCTNPTSTALLFLGWPTYENGIPDMSTVCYVDPGGIAVGTATGYS